MIWITIKVENLLAKTTAIPILNINTSMSTLVLVLNSQYLPINITSIQRAFNLIFSGEATVEKHSDSVWHSAKQDFILPAVIRLINFHKLPVRNYKLSKKNIGLRDKFTCQYCSKKLSERTLTIDHVIPSSRGGSSKWDNLVCACHSCNTKKADRTPDEAAMPLLSKPNKISSYSHTTILRFRGLDNPHWIDYLFV